MNDEVSDINEMLKTINNLQVVLTITYLYFNHFLFQDGSKVTERKNMKRYMWNVYKLNSDKSGTEKTIFAFFDWAVMYITTNMKYITIGSY